MPGGVFLNLLLVEIIDGGVILGVDDPRGIQVGAVDDIEALLLGGDVLSAPGTLLALIAILIVEGSGHSALRDHCALRLLGL